MNIKHSFTLGILLSLFSLIGVSQKVYDITNFSGLKSEGNLPLDFKKSLEELYSEDKQRIRDYNDGKLKNKDLLLNASYQIHKMLATGRVLYGDPISVMSERIADKLLYDYPELRKELRFYTVKSPYVNAFATGQGMIFVNIGLVAQLQDESQLAFILAHEIIHYVKKHSLEVLSKTEKRDSEEEGTASEEENKEEETENKRLSTFLKYHNRSHEKETECDRLGLEYYYLKTDYSTEVAEGVFDVLQYAYLPFDEIIFDSTYFNTPYFTVPGDYFLKEVAAITARDDYDDSKSTHPNIKKRREHTKDVLSRASHTSRKKYSVTTPEEFNHIQTLARFECIRQNLIYANYARAFYDTYTLQKEMPENIFLERSKLQALYGLTKYKTYRNTNTIVGNYKDYEGEIQQVYYAFRKLKANELSLITMRALWNAKQKYPSDSIISEMATDIMCDLFEKQNYLKSSFASTFDTISQMNDTVEPPQNSKYDKIKKKKRIQKQNYDFKQYVFTDFMLENTDFSNFMDDCQKNMIIRKFKKAFTPTENVFLFNPSYYVGDRKSEEIKIKKSEKRKNQLVDDIAKVAKQKGMHVIDFSSQRLRTQDCTDFYNDYVALNEWANEFWQTRGSIPMKLTAQSNMDMLIHKYNANTINITFVTNSEYYNRVSSSDIIYGIILFPFLPISIYNMTNNMEWTHIYTLLVDAKNGTAIIKSAKDHNKRDTHSLIKSELYDSFNKFTLKTKKK